MVRHFINTCLACCQQNIFIWFLASKLHSGLVGAFLQCFTRRQESGKVTKTTRIAHISINCTINIHITHESCSRVLHVRPSSAAPPVKNQSVIVSITSIDVVLCLCRTMAWCLCVCTAVGLMSTTVVSEGGGHRHRIYSRLGVAIVRHTTHRVGNFPFRHRAHRTAVHSRNQRAAIAFAAERTIGKVQTQVQYHNTATTVH